MLTFKSTWRLHKLHHVTRYRFDHVLTPLLSLGAVNNFCFSHFCDLVKVLREVIGKIRKGVIRDRTSVIQGVFVVFAVFFYFREQDTNQNANTLLTRDHSFCYAYA